MNSIAEHARSSAPAECCGLLIGTPAEIVESVSSPNLAADPIHAFLLDPAAHIDARRRARAQGLAVVGFYHSHPESDATPSERDADGASYADHVYLIVRPRPSGYEARAFVWSGSRFVETELTVG